MLLGTTSFDPPAQMPSDKAYHILFQTDTAYPGHLTFKPAEMCDFYRIIHYIFTRCMIIKCSSYTYFNQEEYPLLARIIKGERMNIGAFIFGQMKLFCTERTKSMPMPYPQLVSFILQKFKIDHLEKGKKIEVEPFGKVQLNRMHIELPYSAVLGKIPRREKGKQKGISEKAVSESQHQDEAQSTAPPSVQSQPSFLGATIQKQVHKEIEEMEARLHAARKAAEERQEKRFQEIQTELAETRQAVEDVRNLLLAYIQSMGPTFTEEELRGPPSDTQYHPPSPPQDAFFPNPPSPPHTTLPPSPPHTSVTLDSSIPIPPSSSSTAIIPYPHTTDLVDSQLQSLISDLLSHIPSSSSTFTTTDTNIVSSSSFAIAPSTTIPLTTAMIPITPTLPIPFTFPPHSAIPSIFPPIPTPFPLPPQPLSYIIPSYTISNLFDADKKGEKDKDKEKDTDKDKAH